MRDANSKESHKMKKMDTKIQGRCLLCIESTSQRTLPNINVTHGNTATAATRGLIMDTVPSMKLPVPIQLKNSLRVIIILILIGQLYDHLGV